MTDEYALTSADVPVPIHTFLIADIRGYTDYTARNGDEAAARLALSFASLTRAVVERFGGTVPELRGDEALAVFGSPRQALRAAVEMQEEFLAQADNGPDAPIYVGIGIDAGEAVPVDTGFRGGALNTAARLCSEARPGEVLTTQVVTHLARAVEGLTYVDRGRVSLKGLPDAVHVIAVHRTGGEIVAAATVPSRWPVDAQHLPFEELGEALGARVSEGIHIRLQDALSRLDAQTLTRVAERPRIPSAVPAVEAPPPPKESSGTTTNDVIIAALGISAFIILILVVAVLIVLLH